MGRFMKFFPVILAALALATSGSSPILRQASAQQKGGAQPAPPKGGVAKLSAEAERQIAALLEDKQKRTQAQKKISSQLIYATRAARGERMTAGGEVGMLNSAMSIARSAM